MGSGNRAGSFRSVVLSLRLFTMLDIVTCVEVCRKSNGLK